MKNLIGETKRRERGTSPRLQTGCMTVSTLAYKSVLYCEARLSLIFALGSGMRLWGRRLVPSATSKHWRFQHPPPKILNKTLNKSRIDWGQITVCNLKDPAQSTFCPLSWASSCSGDFQNTVPWGMSEPTACLCTRGPTLPDRIPLTLPSLVGQAFLREAILASQARSCPPPSQSLGQLSPSPLREWMMMLTTLSPTVLTPGLC